MALRMYGLQEEVSLLDVGENKEENKLVGMLMALMVFVTIFGGACFGMVSGMIQQVLISLDGRIGWAEMGLEYIIM